MLAELADDEMRLERRRWESELTQYENTASAAIARGDRAQFAIQQAKADHDFVEEVQELKLNTELTREIRELTRELHERIVDPGTSRDELPSVTPQRA